MASTNPSMNQRPIPGSILIIGAGVFGLSTTLSLLSSATYAHTTITLLDPYLPSLTPSTSFPYSRPPQPTQNPHAASIDSSRIIRPDYAVPAYAKLASLAQERWREGFGRVERRPGGEVYRESGVLLTADGEGSAYVRQARENARGLGCRVEGLGSKEEVGTVLGTGGGGGAVGESGYVNWGSGWADAGRAMEGVMGIAADRAREREGVIFKRENARRLLVRGAGSADGSMERKRIVIGVELEDGSQLVADLTIVAAGAWSGALLDLRGRAEARGQVVAYVPISTREKEALSTVPVLLNLSTGMFVMPPVQDPVVGGWVTKVARHSYGYGNPTTVISPEGESITTSLPAARFSPIPVEGEKACREFLLESIPWLGNRPFRKTRICWYTDTPTGDFLIDYHPEYEGLFLATGGSGHGFKFLPVLGEKVVAATEGRLEEELAVLWKWREERVENFAGTEDGSRGMGRRVDLEEAWREGDEGGRSKL